MNTIPIVFSTDNTFVPYCGVAIYSLIKNASIDNTYEIFVLYNRLSKSSVERLESLSTSNALVKCVCINELTKDLVVTEVGHIKSASAYRIFIPELFRKYKEVIYLDSDVIVCDDISELYSTDISGYALGAVHALIPDNDKYYEKVLHIEKDDYFNAGVLLINIDDFLDNQISEKAVELLKSRSDFKFMDQCALNISCQNKVRFIDKKWNFEWMYLFGKYDESYEINNPSIIHYDSVEKPWSNIGEKWADVFWKYARETIFYEEILQNSNLELTGEILRNIGADCFGKRIAIYGAGYIGRRFVRSLQKMKICDVALWVDKDYINKADEIMAVNPIDDLFVTSVDYIIITVLDKKISRDIKNVLVEKGLEESKIKQYQ